MDGVDGVVAAGKGGFGGCYLGFLLVNVGFFFFFCRWDIFVSWE